MSEIKVDDLTGKTSAGDITVTSEGGAATMQLQQGVCKLWIEIDQNSTGHPAYDSFNSSSTADSKTGSTIISFTNVFSNATYADVTSGAAEAESGFGGGNFSTTEHMGVSARQKKSSSVCTDVRTASNNDNDNHSVKVIIMGDLA